MSFLNVNKIIKRNKVIDVAKEASELNTVIKKTNKLNIVIKEITNLIDVNQSSILDLKHEFKSGKY